MLLQPAEFRGLHPTSLDDPTLQILLDAAEVAITRRLSAADAIVERHVTSSFNPITGAYTGLQPSPYIYPARPVASITTVTETVGAVVTTLAANDYRVWPGGWIVERLSTGTNPRTAWTGTIDLTFASASDVADRKRVQAELVQLDLNHNPGLSSERIGDWEQTYVDNSAMHYGLEREAILNTLGTGLVIA